MDISLPQKYSYCLDCSGDNSYFNGIPTSDRDCVQSCESSYFMNYKFADGEDEYRYCVDSCGYSDGLILASQYERDINNLCLRIDIIKEMHVAVQD